MADAALPATMAPTTRPHHLRFWTPGMAAFAVAWLAVYVSVAPAPLELARRNWYLIGVGVVGAFCGNVTAVGGGLVFIPVMIFALHMNAVQALKVAILSQAFGMTSGAIGWARRGRIPRNLFLAAVPALLVGSTISTLVIRPSVILVKSIFGPVSILIGVIILALRNRDGTKDVLPSRVIVPLLFVSLVGGLVTGWVAIGEGEIVAAFLMVAYGLSSERSIGLGVALLSVNSIYLAILHQTLMGGLPWSIAAFTLLGCVYGARLGPFVSQWVPPKALKVGFACIAITDGLMFVTQFLLSHR